MARGRHRGVGVRAAWEGWSDPGGLPGEEQVRAAGLPVTTPRPRSAAPPPGGWASVEAHVLFIRETDEVP